MDGRDGQEGCMDRRGGWVNEWEGGEGGMGGRGGEWRDGQTQGRMKT